MSNKKVVWILLFFIIISFSIAAFIFNRKRPYIILSGKVIYTEYQNGKIEIFWTKRLNESGPPDPRYFGKVIYLNKPPGTFKFRIPENTGYIYICARNMKTMHESLAYFISDPIKICKVDITGYNIVLKKKELLMKKYKGKTVQISGKVICEQYLKGGRIEVCVYTPDWYRKVRLPPDVAKTIASPGGDFSVKIPENFGDIYLTAVNIPEGERSGNSPKCLRARYKGNPLKIEDLDREGIAIIFDDLK